METIEQTSGETGFKSLLTESVEIEGRAATLKTIYLLLGVSFVSAVTGGFWALSNATVIQFFSGVIGWISAMVLLNVVPRVAMAAAERSSSLGVFVLAFDGFVAGVAISPLLLLAAVLAPELILVAFGVTAAVFLSITLYILTTRKRYSAPAALTAGAFVSICVAIVFSNFLELGILGILISVAIALFGVVLLVVNTSQVVRDPQAIGAVPGALMLFAGTFNVFVGVLNLLLRFTGGEE